MLIKRLLLLLLLAFLYVSSLLSLSWTSINIGLSSKINGVAGDALGRIWIATDKGVVLYKGDKTVYTKSNSALLTNSVYSVSPQAGEIMFGDGKGIVSLTNWQNADWTNADITNLTAAISSPVDIKTYAILKDSKSNFWFGTSNGLLYSIGGSQLHQYLPNTNIYSIAEQQTTADTAIVWVGTAAGLLRIKADSASEYIAAVDTFTTANSSLPDDKIYAAAYDKESGLWAATDKGAALYDTQNGTWTIFTTAASGIISNSVRTVIAAGEEVWFGTLAGVSRYNTRTKQWTNYTVFDGLPSNAITCGAKDVYGNILFGTYDGQVAVYNRYWREYSVAAGSTDFPGTAVKSVGITSNDEVYAALFNNAFYGLMYRATADDSFVLAYNGDTITSIQVSGDTVFAQSANSRVIVFEGGLLKKTISLGTAAGGGDIAVYGDTLYITNSGGTFKKSIGSADTALLSDTGFSNIRAFADNIITASGSNLYIDLGGKISLSAGVNDVMQYSDKVYIVLFGDSIGILSAIGVPSAFSGKTVLTASSGAWSFYTLSINQTGGGYSRIISDSAIFIAGSGFFRTNDYLTLQKYSAVDGYSGGDAYTLAKNSEGDIYIGTKNHGLLVYKRSKLAPAPYIVSAPNDIESNSSVSFDYDAYDDRGNAVFSYRLSGPVNYSWSDLSTAKNADFSGLTSGLYTFSLIAEDIDGNRSDTLTYPFIIAGAQQNLSSDGDSVSLYLPSGSVTGVSLAVRVLDKNAIEQLDTGGMTNFGIGCDITPHSTTFSKYAILSFRLDASLTSGYADKDIKIYQWNNFSKKWEVVGGTIENGYIRTAIKSSGYYAPFDTTASVSAKLDILDLSVKPRIANYGADLSAMRFIFDLTNDAAVDIVIYSSAGVPVKTAVSKRDFYSGINAVQSDLSGLYTGLYIAVIKAQSGKESAIKRTGFYVK